MPDGELARERVRARITTSGMSPQNVNAGCDALDLLCRWERAKGVVEALAALHSEQCPYRDDEHVLRDVIQGYLPKVHLHLTEAQAELAAVEREIEEGR